ncbi:MULTISPECIES: hypothetical protein [Chroococcidiopsis]|nr:MULTISPECIES: hypothetical protein [Chroococcidiopsis]
MEGQGRQGRRGRQGRVAQMREKEIYNPSPYPTPTPNTQHPIPHLPLATSH